MMQCREACGIGQMADYQIDTILSQFKFIAEV